MKLLVVEDEPRIASFLTKGLELSGYDVELVTTGREALQRASAADIDLVILDLGLPDIDGLEVMDRLRATGSSVPVVMLTARAETDDRVQGLDLGANDYLVKPFAFDELVARIRARLRDHGIALGRGTSVRIELDANARQALVDGRPVNLSAREYALLDMFVRHRGRAVSREAILSEAWGIDLVPGSNVVDVYVGYLRRKLGGDVIETVRGGGYRLRGSTVIGDADASPS